MLPRILDEEWADREVRRVLQRNYSELCLTNRGYALLMRHSININGGHQMADIPTLYMDENGAVREVLESQVLTLEKIDERIAKAEGHLQQLRNLRVEVDVMLHGSDSVSTPEASQPAVGSEIGTTPETTPAQDAPAAPVPDAQPTPQPQPEMAAPAAGGVELQVTPGDPAVAAAQPQPQPATAAANNGQADPAASSNPTPAVPSQPVINA